MASVGGAVAEGLASGFQMGRSIQQDAEHKREFDAEQAARDAAQARLAKQEDDRYGRMNDAARVQAVESRLATLEKLSTSAIAAGHQPPDSVQQERAELMVQHEDMLKQIASTGRLTAPDTAASYPSPQGIVPNAATDTSPAAPAPAVPATGIAAALGGPAPTASPAPPSPNNGLGATPAVPPAAPSGLGPNYGPAGAPPAMDDNSPIVGAAPPAAAGGLAGAMPGSAPPTGAISSPVTSATNPMQQMVANVDQRSQDLASRLSSGQTTMAQIKPGDYALMMASATKRVPGDLDQVRQHIADFQAGMGTGNNGLTLQGLNGIFGPQINQGVGSPSAYGGTITGKSVIGLDPAMSADGTIHTDKVIPRLQVTTDVQGPDGQPLSYQAPMTQNRSSDPNDPVTAVPMADAVNRVGALGALVETAAHPDAQALLQKGASDPRIQQYLDAIKLGSQPADPVAQKQAVVDKYSKLWGTDNDETVQRLVQLGYLKPVPQLKGTVAQTMDAAQQLVDDGTVDNLPAALKLLQAGGVTKQPSKYSPGAVAAPGAGGTSVGSVPGDPAKTGDDYLATLSPAMAMTVRNIAANPDLLKNVPETKGQRMAMANAVLQYKPDAPLAGAAGMGSRESIYTGRVLNSMHEAVADAQNVMALPLSSSAGFLNLGTPKTLLTAGRQYLMNKVSDDDIQGYNVLSSGFARSLATIETAGLAPGQNFTDSLGKLQLAPGDTELTKMRKMAQTRQIVEAGMQSVLNNPRVPPEQKAEARTAIGQLQQAIPFTQRDLTTMQTQWNDDPTTTMSQIIGKHTSAPAVAGVGAAAPAAPVVRNNSTTPVAPTGGKLVYNPATGGFN